MKYLALLLLLIALPVAAQTQTCKCVTGPGCTVVADIIGSLVTPISCTLKENGNTVGTVNVATGPITGVSPCVPPGSTSVTAPYCAVGPFTYPAGNHTVTVVVNYQDGSKSADSAPYTFASVVTPPPVVPATNLRVK